MLLSFVILAVFILRVHYVGKASCVPPNGGRDLCFFGAVRYLHGLCGSLWCHTQTVSGTLTPE